MPILKYDNICDSSINEQSTFGKKEQIPREELSPNVWNFWCFYLYISHKYIIII